MLQDQGGGKARMVQSNELEDGETFLPYGGAGFRVIRFPGFICWFKNIIHYIVEIGF